MSKTDLVGRARVADDPDKLMRLETLLLRYPQLDPAEHEEAGTLLRETRPLDMGLLSTNAAAWTKAEQFRAENPGFFRPTLALKLLWVAMAVIGIAAIWLLWDIGIE